MSFAKFELGFPNEGWNDKLRCLIVPIPGTDKCLFVDRWKDKFTVHNKVDMHTADNIMMAAAIVHDLINNYVTTGGNLGQNTDAQA